MTTTMKKAKGKIPATKATVKATGKAAMLPSERLGVPPTTPDVDVKVKAIEAAQGSAPAQKSMSLMDAAVHLLSLGTGDPMRCKDIVELAIKRGLWTPRTGKTPASTLYAAILREITLKGEASRFTKTERGKFALKDSAYMREAAAKSGKA